MLLTCSLVAVQKLLSTLPHFLSPYLFNLILVVRIPMISDLRKEKGTFCGFVNFSPCVLWGIRKPSGIRNIFKQVLVFTNHNFVLFQVCELSARMRVSDDVSKKSQSLHRLSSVKQLLCTGIAPRVLIPTLFEGCEHLMKSDQVGCFSLLVWKFFALQIFPKVY